MFDPIISWLKYFGFGDPLVGNKSVAVHTFAEGSVPELRSSVKVEVDVLDSPSLIVRAISVEWNGHATPLVSAGL